MNRSTRLFRKNTLENRIAYFWSLVDKSGGPDACWRWTGRKNNKGYGQTIEIEGTTLAHRIAYILTNGPIPEGYDLCHSCDTPECVNPFHTWPGTRKENMQDMMRKNRGNKTGRRKGHTNKETKPAPRVRKPKQQYQKKARTFQATNPTTVTLEKAVLSQVEFAKLLTRELAPIGDVKQGHVGNWVKASTLSILCCSTFTNTAPTKFCALGP